MYRPCPAINNISPTHLVWSSMWSHLIANTSLQTRRQTPVAYFQMLSNAALQQAGKNTSARQRKIPGGVGLKAAVLFSPRPRGRGYVLTALGVVLTGYKPAL